MATKPKKPETLLGANGCYKTRRHQCLAFELEVKKKRTSVREALRAAAMVGAAEERSRTLKLIQESALTPKEKRAIAFSIMVASVLEVLGWE